MEEKKEHQFSQLFGMIRRAPLWPALATFGLGYNVGVRQALRLADSSSSSTTAVVQQSSLSSFSRTWFLSFALVSLVVREIWRNIPTWLKRQLTPWQQQSSSEAQPSSSRNIENATDDMTSIATILGKLRALSNLASEKLLLDNSVKSKEDNENIEAALLVLLRVIRQVKDHRPEARDDEVCGASVVNQDAAMEIIQKENYQELFELADLAYDTLSHEQTIRDALREYGYELLRHDNTAIPGVAAHYIALNQLTKQAVIGIKGTSSLEDVLTDCCGVGVEYNGMQCHDGILTASKKLAADLEIVVTDLLIPSGYSILLTGHSLGKCGGLICATAR